MTNCFNLMPVSRRTREAVQTKRRRRTDDFFFCWDKCRRDICCSRLSGEQREDKTSQTMPRLPEWVTIPGYIFKWPRRFRFLILFEGSRLFKGRLVCLM